MNSACKGKYFSCGIQLYLCYFFQNEINLEKNICYGINILVYVSLWFYKSLRFFKMNMKSESDLNDIKVL